MARKRKAPKATSKLDKCATKRCRNKKAARVTYRKSAKGAVIRYEGHLNHCWKCRSRMLKKSQSATYVLNNIRNRARQRRVPFTITLAEFKKWCQETGYLETKGRNPESSTIGRKDHDKGYHIGNIKIETFQENCANGHVVPGRDCAQNAPNPETYDCDFAGPEPDYTPPVSDTEPF